MDDGVRLLCPITRGSKTSITKTALDKLCEKYREEAKNKSDRAKVPLIYPCKSCDPAKIKELEILKDGGEQMAEGTCECCGMKANLKNSYEKMSCSTCSIIRGRARNNPQTLINILNEFGVDLDQKKAEQANTVELEERHIKQMCELKDSYVLSIGEKDKEIDRLKTDLDDLCKMLDAAEKVAQSSVPVVTAEKSRYIELACRLSLAIILEDVSSLCPDDVRLLAGVRQ